MDVSTNKPDTHISSVISPSTIQNGRQEISLPMDNENIESTECSIASQLSNVGDEEPIQLSMQPCTNFSKQFKKSFLPDIDPASLLTSLENDHSNLTSISRCVSNTTNNLDEYEGSTSSTTESTPAAPIISQATPRKPLFKKKDNSSQLESSLILLCQSMHQRFQDNCNFEVTDSSDEIFVRLIVNQLKILPPHEKQKRQQTIMQILYEPYDS